MSKQSILGNPVTNKNIDSFNIEEHPGYKSLAEKVNIYRTFGNKINIKNILNNPNKEKKLKNVIRKTSQAMKYRKSNVAKVYEVLNNNFVQSVNKRVGENETTSKYLKNNDEKSRFMMDIIESDFQNEKKIENIVKSLKITGRNADNSVIILFFLMKVLLELVKKYKEILAISENPEQNKILNKFVLKYVQIRESIKNIYNEYYVEPSMMKNPKSSSILLHFYSPLLLFYFMKQTVNSFNTISNNKIFNTSSTLSPNYKQSLKASLKKLYEHNYVYGSTKSNLTNKKTKALTNIKVLANKNLVNANIIKFVNDLKIKDFIEIVSIQIPTTPLVTTIKTSLEGIKKDYILVKLSTPLNLTNVEDKKISNYHYNENELHKYKAVSFLFEENSSFSASDKYTCVTQRLINYYVYNKDSKKVLTYKDENDISQYKYLVAILYESVYSLSNIL